MLSSFLIYLFFLRFVLLCVGLLTIIYKLNWKLNLLEFSPVLFVGWQLRFEVCFVRCKSGFIFCEIIQFFAMTILFSLNYFIVYKIVSAPEKRGLWAMTTGLVEQLSVQVLRNSARSRRAQISAKGAFHQARVRVEKALAEANKMFLSPGTISRSSESINVKQRIARFCFWHAECGILFFPLDSEKESEVLETSDQIIRRDKPVFSGCLINTQLGWLCVSKTSGRLLKTRGLTNSCRLWHLQMAWGLTILGDWILPVSMGRGNEQIPWIIFSFCNIWFIFSRS